MSASTSYPLTTLRQQQSYACEETSDQDIDFYRDQIWTYIKELEGICKDKGVDEEGSGRAIEDTEKLIDITLSILLDYNESERIKHLNYNYVYLKHTNWFVFATLGILLMFGIIIQCYILLSIS